MKKKIFIDAGPLLEWKMSGIGHTTHSIVQFLSQSTSFCRDYEIRLLYPKNKKDLIDRFQFNENVTSTFIPIKARILNGLAKYNLLPPMDIFFGTGTYLFPNFKNWPLLRSKSITYIHDVAFRIFPEYVEPANLKMLNRSVARYMRRTDRIVTVSNSSKADIVKHFPDISPGKVKVIHNGVDPEFFKRRKKAEIERVRSEYNLPPSYFIYISNIEPRKNLKTLLSAFDTFAETESDTALILIGGMGWLNEDIVDRIEELQQKGRLVIRPNKYVPDDDLPALLSGARALIHVPVHEGFGISPLQAIACGTPAIVSSIPSLKEVLGGAGTYVNDLRDPKELAQLMVDAASESPDETTRGRLRAQAIQFSWKEKTADLEELIRDVAI